MKVTAKGFLIMVVFHPCVEVHQNEPIQASKARFPSVFSLQPEHLQGGYY